MIAGFELITPLYQGDNVDVARYVRLRDGRHVVIKKVRNAALTPLNRARVKVEYDLLVTLQQQSVAGVALPIDFIDTSITTALVTDDTGGESLEALTASGSLALHDILLIGIALAELLGDLARVGVVHKRINLRHVVWNRDTSDVRLVDFTHAQRTAREQPQPDPLFAQTKDADSMAPEQTGRTRYTIDGRTDMYGLGATLYALLAHQRVLGEHAQHNLVYAVLAVVPTPATDVRPSVPRSVSGIVSKLLEKSPDNRYQGAVGLLHDLRLCSAGAVEPFVLGSQDQARQFSIPQQLYGRENSIGWVLQAFEAALRGVTQSLLISGPTGSGKTALAFAAQPFVTQHGAMFCVGRSEARAHPPPFAPLSQCIAAWVRQILQHSDPTPWRVAARDAVAPFGRVLIEIAPALALLLGEQPPVPTLAPLENDSRARSLWHRLIQALAAVAPVVLVIDDVQWADSATLRILRHLNQDVSAARSLLIVMILRDDDVVQNPLVQPTLTEMRESPNGLRELTVSPLKRGDIAQLVHDATAGRAEEVDALAALLHEKTQGNALFIHELLKDLSVKRVFRFDAAAHQWTWDLAAVAAAGVPRSGVKMLVGQLGKLSRTAQAVMSRAACMGREFSVDLLVMTGDLSRDDTRESVAAALELGLITVKNNVYKFAHDHVQTAASAMLDAVGAMHMHYAIARYLMQAPHPGSIENWTFRVADHLNAAESLVIQAGEQGLRIECNLLAGKTAKNDGAYDTALVYLNHAHADVSEAMAGQAAIAREIRFERIDNTILTGAPGAAERDIDAGLATALDGYERAELLLRRLHSMMHRNDYSAALDAGVQALAALNEKVILHPSPLRLRRQFWRMRWAELRATRAHDAPLPLLRDRLVRFKLQILHAMMPAALSANSRLLRSIALRMATLTFEFGRSVHSYSTYAAVGGNMALDGHTVVARRYVALAKKLRTPDSLGAPFSEWLVETCVEAVAKTPSEQLEELERIHELQHRTGDAFGAAYSLMTRIRMLAALSTPQCLDLISAEEGFIASRKTPLLKQWVAATQQLCLCLQGRTHTLFSLGDDAYDTASIEESVAQQKSVHGLIYYHYKTLALVVHAEPFGARQAGLEAVRQGLLLYTPPQAITIYAPFVGLALTAHARCLGLKTVLDSAVFEQVRSQLAHLGRHGAAGAHAAVVLLDAECAALRGDDVAAKALYTSAVELLETSDYVALTAVGQECHGRFEAQRGGADAQAILVRARNAYERWGAEAQVQRMDEEMGRAWHAAHGVAVDVKALTAAAQSLMQIDAAKRSYFANISHEFRTPLSLILAPLEEILRGQELPDGLRASVLRCQHQGFRLLHLVDDVLELSRLEVNLDAGHSAPMSFARLLDGMHRDITSVAMQQGVKVTLEVLGEGWVEGDEEELQRAVAHLLAEVMDDATTPHIALRMLSQPSSVELTIDSPEANDAAERRVPRLQTSHVGRALCRKIIEAHGGTLRFAAEDNISVAVRLTLPGCAPPSDSATRTTEAMEKSGASDVRAAQNYKLRAVFDALERHSDAVTPRLGDPKILVIDFSESTAWRVATALGDDYAVHAVSDISAGLHIAWETQPDLIVFGASIADDVAMPTIAQLRTSPITQSIPLILLRDGSFAQARRAEMASSVDAALSDAFDAGELRSTVANLLRGENTRHTDIETLRDTELRLMVRATDNVVQAPLAAVHQALQALQELSQQDIVRLPETSQPIFSDRVKEACSSVQEGVQRVEHALGELSNYTLGKEGAPWVTTQLADVVTNLQRLLSHKVRFVPDVRSTAAVTTRRGQIEQVLLNLLLNASRAAGAGGSISVQTWDGDDDAVYLAVCDNGPGITADNMKRLFQPYFTTKFDGTGLGLAVSRRIVREHGGELTARSVEGQGATFTLRLPRAVQTQKAT